MTDETKEDTLQPTGATQLEPADFASYLTLRQSIDLFESVALALYSRAKDVDERTLAAEAVKTTAFDFREGNKGPGCGANEHEDAHGNCIPDLPFGGG